jgi:hypothetical protein
MRKVAIAALVALGVLGIGTVATADDDDGSGRNSARLNGYQEVTSLSTRGFGSFHVKINKNRTADYVLTYRDVETPVTQAHIHFAQRSQNGPIEVWLCDGDPNAPPTPPALDRTLPVCPPSTTTTPVRGTFTAAEVGDKPPDRGIEPGAWEEFVAAVKVGHTYANVHSTRFPGGEIRGQINDRDQKEYTGPPPFATGDNDDD